MRMAPANSEHSETAIQEELVSASVVICTFTEDRWESLVTAMTASLTQSHLPLQVVLVIDHNRSLFERCRDERETWQDLANVEILILENQSRRGIGGSRTIGVEASTSQVVVFLDDDAVPSSNWLEELVHPFRQENVMMTSGWLNPRWVTNRPAWFPDEFLWVIGCSYRGLPDDGEVIRNPIGASMAIRKSVTDQVGIFRSHLGRNQTDGNGCEETEYAIRAHQQFPEMVVVHAVRSTVEHLVPAGRTTLKYFVKRCWREGRSKAILVEIVGQADGLSAERSYATSVLPRGVAKGLCRLGTWGQSGAIIAGALVTSVGYISARLRLRLVGNT